MFESPWKTLHSLLFSYTFNYFVLVSWLHTEFPVALAHCMFIRTIALTFRNRVVHWSGGVGLGERDSELHLLGMARGKAGLPNLL